MAATSVSTALNRIRYKIVDPDSANFSDAELLIYLNEANRTIRNLIAFHAPDFLLTTDEGSVDPENDTIMLSNVAVKINDVTIDGRSIPMISKARIRDVNAEGKPEGYFMQDFNQLRLYPKPTGTHSYTVTFVSNCEALEMVDDLPYPEMFDDLLGEYVVMRCIARDEGTPTIEAELFSSWRNQITSLLSSFGYNESRVQGYYSNRSYPDDYGVV